MCLLDSDYMLTAEFQFTRMAVSFKKGKEKKGGRKKRKRKKEKEKKGGGGA